MLVFKKVNHPDDKPMARSYACRAQLWSEPETDDPELVGSFWVLGNPGYYILRTELKSFEVPAHFYITEILNLTEESMNYVAGSIEE